MLVGVLGGGQLGRMLALAGYPLGLRFRFLDPSSGAPAGQVGHRIAGAFDDPSVLARFAEGLDVVTYEFESVPIQAARSLAEEVPVYPPPRALEVSQDRCSEKDLFARLNIPVPPFRQIDSFDQLEAALRDTGVPAILKTRRFGYDGKGQISIRSQVDARAAFDSLGGADLIVEAFVPFDREVSILAARSKTGAAVFYPLVENHHRNGILRLSLPQAPASGAGEALQRLAEEYAFRVLEELDYTAVLAIEFFQCGGHLIANEMAPRVHNSGHWTIEGAETSQFENHVRAVCGLPLGSTEMLGHSAMINLIGAVPDPARVLKVPGAHLHLYGKQARPGRKLGHITVRTVDEPGLHAALERLRAILPEQP